MEIKTSQQIKGGKWIIGMVYVDALPETPMHTKLIQFIANKSIEEAIKCRMLVLMPF
jgi:predicted TIM-barrel enzyme